MKSNYLYLPPSTLDITIHDLKFIEIRFGFYACLQMRTWPLFVLVGYLCLPVSTRILHVFLLNIVSAVSIVM